VNIYVNGNIIEEEQAVVSVYDHGFLYGMGLFETFRTYNGKPFLLDEHVRRMASGCDQLGILYRAEPGEWRRILSRLLEVNGLRDAYIRFTVTAGSDALGLPGDSYAKPNVVVYIKALPPRSEELYRDGKPLQLLQLKRNTPEGTGRLKSLHYMNNVLAKRELLQYPWAGQAEGLFTDIQGHLAEGIVSNLFFFTEERLCTPSLNTGILPGITRAYVMRLAEQTGINTEEGLYTWDDLLAAEEVFITNSIQEIVPVSSLIDREGLETVVGCGRERVQTNKLMQLYRQQTQLTANEGGIQR
jgi:4-amino-4-deoxychorismate lyase